MQTNIHPQLRRVRNSHVVSIFSIVLVLLMVTLSACTGSSGSSKSNEKSIPYDVFLIKVKQGEIDKIGLSADRTQALVHDRDGTRAIVDLPAEPQLIDNIVKNVKGGVYILPANFKSP